MTVDLLDLYAIKSFGSQPYDDALLSIDNAGTLQLGAAIHKIMAQSGYKLVKVNDEAALRQGQRE